MNRVVKFCTFMDYIEKEHIIVAMPTRIWYVNLNFKQRTLYCYLKCTFSFLRTDVKARRDVEYHLSKRNVFRIRRKVGNGVS